MNLAVRNFLHLLQPLHNRDQIRVRNLQREIFVPKVRDATYVELDRRIAAAKTQFQNLTGHLWNVPEVDFAVMPAHDFQFLMHETHTYLRRMRHLIGKKSRVVVFDEA